MHLSSLLQTTMLGLSLLSVVFAIPTQLTRRNIPVTLNTNKPVTLYRAVYHPSEMADPKTYFPIGNSPVKFYDFPGDFSAHGGYYMFESREEALYWGNQWSGNPKQAGKFILVEIQYTPAKKPDVLTFQTADATWQKFLASNQPPQVAGKPPPKLPARPSHSVIEGPLSITQRGQEVQAMSPLNGKPMWQYAVVWQEDLNLLKIVKATTYTRDKNWQSDPKKVPKAFAADTKEWSRYCPSCVIQ